MALSNRLTLHAAVACLLLLSACASTAKPPPQPSAAAPVAASSSDGDVTVYSLDNGKPLPATPPSPPAAPAPAPQPSIKHKLFGWMHGSDNDTISAPPATAAANEPVPSHEGVPPLTVTQAPLPSAGPPPDSKAEKGAPPPWTTPTSGDSESDNSGAPSDQNAGKVSPPPSDNAAPAAAPAPSRMLTGKSSALTPPPKAERETDVADMAPESHTGDPVRVYFAHNRTRLGPDAQAAIAKIASAHNDNHLPIQVEGHASIQAKIADPVHRAIVNLKVAMDRALSVTNALIQAGVPAAAIQTIAFGDTRPSLAVDGKSEEAASRRVEVYTVGSQTTDVVSAF